MQGPRVAGKLGCNLDLAKLHAFIKANPGIMLNGRMFIKRQADGSLPPVPTTFPFGRISEISEDDWLMLMNDSLGCCVISGIYHQAMDELVSGGATDTWTEALLDPLVVKEYSKYGGYVPGNPNTDQGTDPITAMQGAITNGFPMPNNGLYQVKFFFVIALQDANRNSIWDSTIQEEIEYMVAYFGGGGFCFTVTQAMMDLFTAGKPWLQASVAAGNTTVLGGHYTYMLGQQTAADGVLVTWAKLQEYDWDFVRANASAILFPVTQQMINAATGKDPEGLDWTSALALYNTIQGGMQPPAPPTVTSIALNQVNVAVDTGATVQLTATATMSDGTVQNVTSTCNWQTGNEGIATVTGGLVTGVAAGTTDVIASVGTVSTTATVVVSANGTTFTTVLRGQASLAPGYGGTLKSRSPRC